MNGLFFDKKVMIIVPHEDDELNTVGGMMCSNYFNPRSTYICYMTNGDYLCNHNKRVNEAIKVAKKNNIPKENIIFMGYSDQLFKENNHIYSTHKPDVFTSKKGNNETFCTKKINEYHYRVNKCHAKYNYEKLLEDYINLLKEYKPDVIFAIDFDSHCDHRALSLIFEKSLGIVLKENLNYTPLVYKAFAYPTAYKGVEDFDNINIESSKFNEEINSICNMMNPYYRWEDRIRFAVKNNKLLSFNKLYKLLKIHRSQLIIKKAKKIINSDNVFWQRRTDNLLNESNIFVSSGKKEYLNDFVLFEVDDIMHGDIIKPKLINSAWIPDKNDKKKSIKINFNIQKEVKLIKFYQNLASKDRIKKIELLIDDKRIKKELNEKAVNCIEINKKCKCIEIIIIEKSGDNAGFSEIEVLPATNDIFSYYDSEINNYYGNDKLFINDIDNITIYHYNGYEQRKLKSTEYEFEKYKNKKIDFFVNNIKIKTVKIKKYNLISKIINKIINKINDITISVDIFIEKCFNKINRIMKRL